MNNFDKILNSNFNNLMSVKNHIGGTESSNNIITLFIGIIFMIVGIFVYMNNDTWIMTTAKITNVIKDSDDTYKINFTYSIGPNNYNKLLLINKKNVLYDFKKNSDIKIYYLKSDFNVIKLHDIDHCIFGMTLTIIGMITIICFIYDYFSSSEQIKSGNGNSEVELYTKLSSKDNMNIFYTK